MTKKLKTVCQLDSNPLNSGVLAAVVVNSTELPGVPSELALSIIKHVPKSDTVLWSLFLLHSR